MDVVLTLLLLNLTVEGMKSWCHNMYICIYVVILYSDEVSDQIETVILTREIYELCEIESGEFCEGVSSSAIWWS